MTDHATRRARLDELDRQIATHRKRLATLRERRARTAEQAAAPPDVLGKGYNPGARAALQQELLDIDGQVDDLQSDLRSLEGEARELRHVVSGHDRRLTEARRLLAEAPARFNGPLVYQYGAWLADAFQQWQRDLIHARMLLRAAGEEVPDTLTIVLDLRDSDPPTPDPLTVVPAEEAPEAECIETV